MSDAEQRLRESLTWTGGNVGKVISRLLGPIPALDDESWEVSNEELALIEYALRRYRAWLIGDSE